MCSQSGKSTTGKGKKQSTARRTQSYYATETTWWRAVSCMYIVLSSRGCRCCGLSWGLSGFRPRKSPNVDRGRKGVVGGPLSVVVIGYGRFQARCR